MLALYINKENLDTLDMKLSISNLTDGEHSDSKNFPIFTRPILGTSGILIPKPFLNNIYYPYGTSPDTPRLIFTNKTLFTIPTRVVFSILGLCSVHLGSQVPDLETWFAFEKTNSAHNFLAPPHKTFVLHLG